MRVIVKVKTRAKEEKIERIGQPSMDFDSIKNEMVVYKISVKEAPVQGKANEAIIRVLAEYFEISKSKVKLVSGQTSKQKFFEIL